MIEVRIQLSREMPNPESDRGALPWNRFDDIDEYQNEPGLSITETFRRQNLSDEKIRAELESDIEEKQQELRQKNGMRFTGDGFECHHWEIKKTWEESHS